MKKTFQTIVQTRLFDALTSFVLFLIIALGIDYATESRFSLLTVLADIGISLAAAMIVYIGANRPPPHISILKRRSEHFAVAGKFAIGLLLFIMFIILYVSY